jgi:putative transposase
MGFTKLQEFQSVHKRWVEASLRVNESKRESHWTESLAVGSKSFIEELKMRLGFKAKGRSITGSNGEYRLRENISSFGKTSMFGFEPVAGAVVEMANTFFWD